MIDYENNIELEHLRSHPVSCVIKADSVSYGTYEDKIGCTTLLVHLDGGNND